MDGRDVGQREEAVVDAQVDGAQAFFRAELPADANGDALRPGLDEARGGDGVLRRQRVGDGLDVEAQRRDLAGREFEIDGLVLLADQIDAADIGHGQDARAREFDLVAQLPQGQAVGGEGVDIAEHVAEAVVEERPLHARGKLALDVRDHVADADPGRLDVARPGRGQQVDEDDGVAGGGDRAGEIERFQLFELALDPLGDLQGDFVGGGAGPVGLDHHGLDGEVRIFLAAEIDVGEQARQQEDQHEIPDQRAAIERPLRQVETAHGVSLP